MIRLYRDLLDDIANNLKIAGRGALHLATGVCVTLLLLVAIALAPFIYISEKEVRS